MAKHAIFLNNSLFKIASTDASKDDILSRWIGTVAKSVTDSEYTNLREKKSTATLSGDTVTHTSLLGDGDSAFSTSQAVFEIELADAKELVELFLQSNTDSGWSNYLNQLNAIDVSTITFPLANTFDGWFIAQSGHEDKSILELP